MIMFIDLPPQIPAECIKRSAEDYNLPSVILLGIILRESGGKPNAVGRNKNGTFDIGLTQFNYGATGDSWLSHLERDYGIAPKDMFNPCQAVRATAYAVRVETNRPRCRGDVWCGVGYYHSPNQPHRNNYISAVWSKVSQIQRTGEFK